MIKTMFLRVLKIIGISIICSLPIYFGAVVGDSARMVLCISFIMFIAAIGVDTYKFSLKFWKRKNFYLEQLLPVLIYSVLGFLTSLVVKPVIFNKIFLPLRFAGNFGLVTQVSIGIVLVVLIVLVTIVRLIGSKVGYSSYNFAKANGWIDDKK